MREPGAASIVVESRRSRRHYGTMAYEPFDENKHDSSKKCDHLSLPLGCTLTKANREPSPFSTKDRVQAMQWLIHRVG